MIPSYIPKVLKDLTEEMLIARALGIMKVCIKEGILGIATITDLAKCCHSALKIYL